LALIKIAGSSKVDKVKGKGLYVHPEGLNEQFVHKNLQSVAVGYVILEKTILRL